MEVYAILLGVLIVMIALFAIAELIFGPAGAILLAGAIGYGFGGPPGGGAGLVVGLVLIVIISLLGGTPRSPDRVDPPET